MGTIKIGSAKNKQGITVNPSVILFNGNNVKNFMRGENVIWSHIKALIPQMTSNTTPSGNATSSDNGTGKPYQAFDGDINTEWNTPKNASYYVQYQFNELVEINKVILTANQGSNVSSIITVSTSTDGSTFIDRGSVTMNSSVKTEFTINFNKAYIATYIRFTLSNGGGINLAQVYGKQLKALIPQMTSNTTPSGVTSASSAYTSDRDAYKAFDNDVSTSWHSVAGNPQWLQYEFAQSTCVRAFEVTTSPSGGIKGIFQASNNGTDWVTLKSGLDLKNASTTYAIEIDNLEHYTYYRLYIEQSYYVHTVIMGLQFYG